jgi:hypothetical protein
VGGTLLENGHLQLIHFVILQLIFNCKWHLQLKS